jgi:hypothetical protein
VLNIHVGNPNGSDVDNGGTHVGNPRDGHVDSRGPYGESIVSGDLSPGLSSPAIFHGCQLLVEQKN